MLKALLAVLRGLRRAWLIELAGAVCVVVAVTLAWGVAAGLGAAGVALMLKALEIDGEQ